MTANKKEALGKAARRAWAAQTRKPTDRLGKGALCYSSEVLQVLTVMQQPRH
jgi:hypothetical protein